MSRFRYGFSLLELAIVLAVVGVITGYVLKGTHAIGTKDCYVQTKKQLENARDAIERYAMAHDRFPMPARRNVGVESPIYGREAAVSDLDVVSGAVFGALPFQVIGIPSENAADCWGNKLTYVVTQDLTNPTKFLLPATSGAISINSTNANVFLAGAGYAIISHGADQLGAVKNNYSTATNTLADRKWCTADASQLRTKNCDLTNNILISSVFNDGKDAAGNFFDDLIVYRGKPWRLSTISAINGACGATAQSCTAGTPNGYSAGACGGNQTWTCSGSNGGTNASCSLANAACPVGPANGSCGASPYTCNSGTSINQQSWYGFVPSVGIVGMSEGKNWTCAGVSGGSDVACTSHGIPMTACRTYYPNPWAPYAYQDDAGWWIPSGTTVTVYRDQFGIGACGAPHTMTCTNGTISANTAGDSISILPVSQSYYHAPYLIESSFGAHGNLKDNNGTDLAYPQCYVCDSIDSNGVCQNPH